MRGRSSRIRGREECSGVSMSADATEMREASSSAFPFAIPPRGQLAAVIDAPLQMRGAACSGVSMSADATEMREVSRECGASLYLVGVIEGGGDEA
jgi:hypothetical protein